MKILVFVCGVIAVCSAIPSIYEEWTSFKSLHGKEYKTVKEENYRLGVFLANKEFIEEHNAKFEAGLVSFQLKLNRFSDKLPEEVSLELNGYNRSGLAGARKPGLLKFSGYKGELPASVDWRELGAVTPVKDQGSCGACWAFSTTGSLEGQLFKKTGKLVSLSEQNLVDCSNEKYGNEGCGGGLMDRAFNYIRDNQGIDSEDSYPYEAQQNKCRFRKTSVAGSLQNFVDIPENDEKALQEAVATVGPISVAINAEPKTFTFYKDGIYDDATCNPGTLTHGVLLVGYGTENGKDYWLVKNSWNVNWGDKGYVKIARNKGNLCGIAAMASYPTV